MKICALLIYPAERSRGVKAGAILSRVGLLQERGCCMARSRAVPG